MKVIINRGESLTLKSCRFFLISACDKIVCVLLAGIEWRNLMKKVMWPRRNVKWHSLLCNWGGRTPYSIAIRAPLTPTILQVCPLTVHLMGHTLSSSKIHRLEIRGS